MFSKHVALDIKIMKICNFQLDIDDAAVENLFLGKGEVHGPNDAKFCD